MPAPRLPEPAAWAHRAEGAAKALSGDGAGEEPPPIRSRRRPPGSESESRAGFPVPPDPLDWRPPPSFRERALSAVGTPALVGSLVFAAAIMSVILLVLAQPHTPDDSAGPLPGVAEGEGDAGADTATAGTGGAVAGETGGTVFVHVVGEVHTPGVVELEAGARVQEAIDTAGGATEAAVLDGINLARIVGDGEQIVVPDAARAAASAANPGQVPGPASGAPGGVINLNAADASALEALPRVGPSLAQRIIEWRQANGPFTSIEQLLDVSGIGRKTLDGFRDRVSV